MSVAEYSEFCVPDCTWGVCSFFLNEFRCNYPHCDDMHYIAFCMFLDGSSHM